MKVYLDNCCFNRPYDDQSSLRVSLETQAKLAIQQMIRTGDVHLASSYVLLYENQQNPFVMRRMRIFHFLKKYSSTYISSKLAGKIEKIADPIISTGIKTMDAYHVACALEAGCDYLLTTDDRLLKYQSSALRLCNPFTFIQSEIDPQ